MRKFNSSAVVLLSQLLLESTLRGSLLHPINMDLKVIAVFALMAVFINVSNGELCHFPPLQLITILHILYYAEFF